jgi:hypothetical protein
MHRREEKCVLTSGGEIGNRLLGRPRHRWDYNIKMSLKEIG